MIYVYFIIKEAVCEYRLFFYLYYRLQRNFRVLRVIRGFFLGSLKARNLLGKSCLRFAYGKKYFREIAILNRFLDRLGP